MNKRRQHVQEFTTFEAFFLWIPFITLQLHNLIFSKRLHRYEHYYKCVDVFSVTFFCNSNVCRFLIKEKKKNILFCVPIISFSFCPDNLTEVGCLT